MNRAQAGCATINADGLLDLARIPCPSIGWPSSSFGAEVVAGGIEFEGAVATIQRLPFGLELGRLADVDADAGEHARELLHVLLRVAAVHAEGVQLHQLARVVLVDMAGGVLIVVQILQHRRMFERRHAPGR